MARTDGDSWDLASSVGRDGNDGRRAARAGPPGEVDRRSLRRTAGAGRRPGLLHRDTRRDDQLRGPRPRVHRAHGSRGYGRADPLLRPDVPRRRSLGGAAGGDPRRRTSTPGRTACPGRRHRGLRGGSTRGHRVQDRRRLPNSAPTPTATHARSPSICARTGPRHCGTTGSIRPSRRHGAPRGC